MTDASLRNEAAAERRARILSKVRVVGFVSIADLTRELGVSSMTIRRDLHTLESTGCVRMVHGGAGLAPAELRRRVRPDVDAQARGRVARHAAALAGVTDTVAIDAGPTAAAIAWALPEDFEGCVLTHSLPVLQFFAQRSPAARIVALGGELLADRSAFVGPATEATVAQLRARIFFLSPCAVDADGIYARSPAEASVQRSLMQIADRVVLVSTREVFAMSAPARVAPLHRIAALVTDRRPPVDVARVLARAGADMHLAAC